MWKLTLKNLKARKLRLVLTSLAVVLGVGFVSGTLVLTDTMNSAFDNLFIDVTEGIDVVVRGESEFESQLGGSRQPFSESLLTAVLEVDGIRAAAGSVSGFAQFVDKQGDAVTTGGAPTLGVSWYAEPSGSLVIRQGRAPVGPGDVVVDAGTADRHDFKVGDLVTVITLVGPRDFEISGIAGFGDADNLGGATLAVFDLPTAQDLFDRVGLLDAIDIAAEDGVTVDQLQQRLDFVLPDGVEAASADNVAAEQAENLKSILGFFGTFLLAFAGISLFVGAFLIFNTFSITVAQRTREFGLLRALGAGGGQITGAVFLEALLIGIFASAVGIAAGFGIAIALNAILEAFGIDLPSQNLVFLPRTAVVAVAVGIGVTLASAIAPARRAAKVSPMSALRESSPQVGGFSARRTITGLLIALLGVGILMAGLFAEVDQPVQLVGAGAFVTFLGVAALAPLVAGPLANAIGSPLAALKMPGKLARRNAARNPKRTASTASALMIGLALVGLVSIMGESLKASTDRAVDESLRADFSIAPRGFGAPAPIGPALGIEIQALSEVEVATPIRLGQFRDDQERSRFLVGVDPLALESVADIAVSAGSVRSLREGEVFVFGGAAEDLGLQVGDSLAAWFAATGRQNLRVAGLFDSKSLLQSDYIVSLSTYDANIPQATDLQLLVKLADGITAPAGRAALETVMQGYPNLQLQDQTEAKESSATQVNQLLGLVNALLALALIIALLGITNTLALSVFERTRELGLLRAVGMGRRQTRGMIRWEAVIISVIGAVLGLAIGVFFGWALVTSLEGEGVSELVIPFGQLAVFVLAAALAGVLAALPPARRAARLNVLDAISTE